MAGPCAHGAGSGHQGTFSLMSSTTALARARDLISRRPPALDLLRQYDFRNFWLANAGSDLGDHLRFVAVA